MLTAPWPGRRSLSLSTLSHSRANTDEYLCIQFIPSDSIVRGSSTVDGGFAEASVIMFLDSSFTPGAASPTVVDSCFIFLFVIVHQRWMTSWAMADARSLLTPTGAHARVSLGSFVPPAR
ncbi:unnamed protein product [Ectocarpus sp. 6 AP-2014]